MRFSKIDADIHRRIGEILSQKNGEKNSGV
jgi:hypothetical protein